VFKSIKRLFVKGSRSQKAQTETTDIKKAVSKDSLASGVCVVLAGVRYQFRIPEDVAFFLNLNLNLFLAPVANLVTVPTFENFNAKRLRFLELLFIDILLEINRRFTQVYPVGGTALCAGWQLVRYVASQWIRLNGYRYDRRTTCTGRRQNNKR